MPRRAREKCNCSIYHISIRGNNRQNIFLDDEDRNQYLLRLRRYKEKYKIEIYAYCLMTNHVHLLVFDNNQDISKFMQGLSLSYVIYFNKKYNCSGHLFQDRFTSNVIKNDAYLIYASKYIHLNPVRAGLVSNPADYRWSSYSLYFMEENKNSIIRSEFILGFFASKIKTSRRLYGSYILHEDSELSIDEIATTTEEELNKNIHLTGLFIMDPKNIIDGLEKYWGKSIAEIMTSNQKNKRNMLVYLCSLVGRKNYKEIGQLLHIQHNNVGIYIKTIVDLIIKDSTVFEQRERLLMILQKLK